MNPTAPNIMKKRKKYIITHIVWWQTGLTNNNNPTKERKKMFFFYPPYNINISFSMESSPGHRLSLYFFVIWNLQLLGTCSSIRHGRKEYPNWYKKAEKKKNIICSRESLLYKDIFVDLANNKKKQPTICVSPLFSISFRFLWVFSSFFFSFFRFLYFFFPSFLSPPIRDTQQTKNIRVSSRLVFVALLYTTTTTTK